MPTEKVLGSISGRSSPPAFCDFGSMCTSAAAVFTAGVLLAMMMVMVVAFGIGIISKVPCNKALYRLVCISCDTAIELDTCLGKWDARRQLTAKFRKELAQRQRGGAETYEAQAVDQTEEVTAAAIEEVTQQAGRGGQRASAALQKHRQKKQRQHRQEAGNGQRQPPASPAQGSSTMPTGATRTPETPVVLTTTTTGGRSDAAMPQTNGTAPVPPTPQERMRQKLVEERREQAGQRQAPVLPQGNDRPGHSPTMADLTTPRKYQKKTALWKINLSIHPSRSAPGAPPGRKRNHRTALLYPRPGKAWNRPRKKRRRLSRRPPPPGKLRPQKR